MRDGDRRQGKEEASRARKPYQKPALLELGSVDELTSGAHGNNLDGVHGVSGS